MEGRAHIHVSVYVHLMRGEFDDLLKWPFCGEVTIKLKKTDPPYCHERVLPLNGESSNLCKPAGECNHGRGFLYFISHDACEHGYLKDDRLVFCISELFVTVSGKTTLLAEIEKVGFLLTMDSINTRLCCGTSS